MADPETSVSFDDEGSDDEFEDALADLKIRPDAEDSEIRRCIGETKMAVHYFLNNEFSKSKEILAKGYGKTLYHTHGKAVIRYLEALMTFESDDINDAIMHLKETTAFLQRHRRKEGLHTSIGKALGLMESPELTEDELHSELILAECLFFRSALTFVQDENLINFIKGGLKIRQAYQTYNSCYKIVKKLDWRQDEMLTHFAGGIFLGCGGFNVYMSVLPPKILSLLEWVGFVTDKKLGFEQLTQAYEVVNLRSDLGALYLLVYHLFIAQQIAAHDEDLEMAEKILDKMLKKYPTGVYFLMFKGRLEEIKGNFVEAIKWLEKSISAQTEWKNFSHICFWELMWCHAFKLEWDAAYKCANELREESNWSKCIYTYLCAVFLLMADDGKEETKKKIDELLKQVPQLKQRIAGKSIPMEKFVCRKARKYFEQGKRLIVPAQEMLYVWNGMTMLAGNAEFRKKHLTVINEEREKLEKLKEEKEGEQDNVASSSTKKSPEGQEFNYFDDYCLLQLLKGVCLKYSAQPLQAELCFSDVKENHKGIRKDHYVTPFSQVEITWMFMEQARYDDSRAILKAIKQDYKHYSHESKLHFRMHSAQTRLNVLTGDSNSKKKSTASIANNSSRASLNSSEGVKF